MCPSVDKLVYFCIVFYCDCFVQHLYLHVILYCSRKWDIYTVYCPIFNLFKTSLISYLFIYSEHYCNSHWLVGVEFNASYMSMNLCTCIHDRTMINVTTSCSYRYNKSNNSTWYQVIQCNSHWITWYHVLLLDLLWCIAKNGDGYMQRGMAKGLMVPCSFMITEVSIRCQKKPGGWYTAYTRVYPPIHHCL